MSTMQAIPCKFLILALVLLLGTGCNRDDSSKNTPTGQGIQVGLETKTDEGSRIKKSFHGLLDALEGIGESIAASIGKLDADTTLLHIQDDTVAVQVVFLDTTKTQGEEQKIAVGAPPLSPAVSAGALSKVISEPVNGFDELSPDLQKKFKNAGRNGRVLPRTVKEAQKFYHDTIPEIIRDIKDKKARNEAIEKFLIGKQWSHIISCKNDPKKCSDDRNGIWETKERNQRRNSKNMIFKDNVWAKSKNIHDTAKIIKKYGSRMDWGKYAIGGGQDLG